MVPKYHARGAQATPLEPRDAHRTLTRRGAPQIIVFAQCAFTIEVYSMLSDKELGCYRCVWTHHDASGNTFNQEHMPVRCAPTCSPSRVQCTVHPHSQLVAQHPC